MAELLKTFITGVLTVAGMFIVVIPTVWLLIYVDDKLMIARRCDKFIERNVWLKHVAFVIFISLLLLAIGAEVRHGK